MTNVDAPLPDLQDQVIDWNVVESLLGDIELSARLFAVLIKSNTEGMADGADLDLTRVKPALEAGTAVQLRYVHEGVEWWDTLMPMAGGVRIVRMQQSD